MGFWMGSLLDFGDAPTPVFASNSKKEKLNKLIDYIDFEYVDEVNTDSIVDLTVDRILSNLDPHSTYIPKENLQDITDSMNGSFVGVGISFAILKDSLAVVEVMKGGPSQEAGIQSGDRILFAENDSLFGKQVNNQKVIEKLKGKAGTNVKLKIFRDNEILDFDITRGRVPLKSVIASYLLDDTIGYVKIDRFTETTHSEFKKALIALLDDGIEELILDLRDNPGGIMQSAEQIADEFLIDDKLIVYTENKKGRIDKTYATSSGNFEQGKVYVLINENSASASEIIAGALQDNDKGTIVGTRSFGKGLVQKEMFLGDGSAVRLTISRYYTPTGRSIQRDYTNGKRDYYAQYMERYRNGELDNVDSIPVIDSLRFTTPAGKVVYGGGGIIPDVFVPKDRSTDNELVSFLSKTVFLRDFVFEYLDTNRSKYSALSRNDYFYDFEVGSELFNAFKQYSKNRNIELDFSRYEQQIKTLIKAKMAEQLFDLSLYHKIINNNDIVIKKVLELYNEEN
jgi:carboxyl-terminal processing protease